MLNLRCRSTQRQAVQPSTRKSNDTKVAKYFEFCNLVGVVPLPASENLICWYIEYLADTFKSPQAVSGYVSAVLRLHKMCRLPPPDMNCFDISEQFKGLKNRKNHVVHKAAPITPFMLNKFYHLLDHSDPFQASIWALYLVCFFLLFRKSNVTPLDPLVFDPKKLLLRQDVHFHDSAILVDVKWAKNIQCSEGAFQAPLLRIPGSVLCPVAAFTNMMSLVPGRKHWPAFSLPDGSAITYSSYLSSIKLLVQAIGKDASCYSTHSFRRGGAVWCKKSHVDDKLLKLQGAWRSSCYEEYLDFPIHDRASTFFKMRKQILNLGY